MKKKFDRNNLPEILEVIHDQYMNLDSIEYNSNTLIIDLKREDIDSSDFKISRRFIIFKKINYPILLSKLIFEGVNSYKIIDDQEIGIYSVNDYTLEDKNLTINFCEKTKLSITFDDQFKVEIIDIKRLDV